jgi:two-component system, chemotaxis family, chemotaxis protein CheY
VPTGPLWEGWGMARSLRILLIDDQSLIRRAMDEYLRHLGHADVDHASGGTEAQALLNARHDVACPYDIVFTDRIMPDMDGMMLLRSCRADCRFDRTAFVILSGESEVSCILEALGCGATSYMIKPATAETFRRTIVAMTEWLDRIRKSPVACRVPTASSASPPSMSPPSASPKFGTACQAPGSGVSRSAVQ